MDFGFSEEQEALRAAVRDYLGNEAPVSYARAMCADPAGITESVWAAVAGLGWLGLTVPETAGGSGLGMLDLAVVLEEAGAVVFPGPLLSTLSLAVPTLVEVASPQRSATLLAEIAAGKRRVTVAVAEESGIWSADRVEAQAKREADGFSLTATKLFVPDAAGADLLVVVARRDDGLGFFEVPCGAPGVSISPMQTIDETRKLYAVELSGVSLAADSMLGDRVHPASSLERIIDVARVALAAEMCGAADRALAMSVEYVQIREQFGRVIGSFQAIQHKLADMKVLVENARSLVYYAAWAIDQDSDDRALAAAMAKAYASEACTKVVADAIQAHGGVGFTWEHDLHLYLKRVKASEHTYGDCTANRERVAGLLEL